MSASSASRRERRPPHVPVSVPDLIWRALLLLTGVALIAWLLRRGPLVAPISLFSSVASTNGFYSASHVVAALACLGGAAGLGLLFARRGTIPGLGPALLVGLPFAGLALATRHAVYPHDARFDLAVAAGMVLLFGGLVAAVGRERGYLAAAGALGGLGVWLAVAGLRQFAAGQPTPTAWTGPAFAAAIPVRISATLHNPNALAAAFLLAVGGAAAVAVAARPWPLRALALLALLPLGAALPLTFSRGAYLGLAVAAVAAAVLLPRGRRLRGCLALGFLALGVAAAAYKVPGVLFRVHTISVQGGGDVQSRFFTWRDVAAIWRTDRLRGVGPGGLNVLYGAHEAPGGKGTYVLIDVPGSADDDLLQWLASTGLIGTALLLVGLGAGLHTFLRATRRRPADEGAAAAVLLAAFAGLAVQGCFEVTEFLLPIEALGALGLAALCGAAGGPLPPPPLRRLTGLALVAGAAFTATALWSGWAPERAFAAGWADVAAGHPAAAIPLLTEAAAQDPTSARNAAALGDAYVQLAYSAPAASAPTDAARATAELAAALRLDPWDGDTWAATASLLRRNGTTTAAGCAEQAAAADNPGSPWNADQLASDLAALGHGAAARTDYGDAARLFPLQLQVYREYGDQSRPYAQEAQGDLQEAAAQWGSGPLPAEIALPLSASACAAALGAAGLPPAAYTALHLGPSVPGPEPRLFSLATLGLGRPARAVPPA